MFNYIEFKNNMFIAAVESYLDKELKGILLIAEDKKDPSKNLYCIVFEDESGYKRSLWCPAPVFEETNLYKERIYGHKVRVRRVSRAWHEAYTKIETMVFSGSKICYHPNQFKSNYYKEAL